MVCTVLTVGFCHILFGTVISVICYFKSCLLGLEFWWFFFSLTLTAELLGSYSNQRGVSVRGPGRTITDVMI